MEGPLIKIKFQKIIKEFHFLQTCRSNDWNESINIYIQILSLLLNKAMPCSPEQLYYNHKVKMIILNNNSNAFLNERELKSNKLLIDHSIAKDSRLFVNY